MAYGARLESVLGESPRGFESPILRGLSRNTSSTWYCTGLAGRIFAGSGSLSSRKSECPKVPCDEVGSKMLRPEWR